MKKWESDKHKSWGMPAEGFKDHVASLLGTAGKWGACGWAVVQLDYDEELGLLLRMYGSMEGELEVQRTFKRTGADGIPLPSQKGLRTCQSVRRQQRNY